MVVIYLSRTCPYCNAARQLLAQKDCPLQEIDVGAHPERRAEMTERSGRYTVPQIWIGERHVGGFDELAALDAKGELDALLREQTTGDERPR